MSGGEHRLRTRVQAFDSGNSLPRREREIVGRFVRQKQDHHLGSSRSRLADGGDQVPALRALGGITCGIVPALILDLSEESFAYRSFLKLAGSHAAAGLGGSAFGPHPRSRAGPSRDRTRARRANWPRGRAPQEPALRFGGEHAALVADPGAFGEEPVQGHQHERGELLRADVKCPAS